MDFSPVLTILGPTASGKTTLAIAIAKRLNGEIIGLDSRQIYTGMAIGTAQPTLEEQDGIPHHLIGFRSPTESISAGEYARLVVTCIDDVRHRKKEPIICGGAGLYFRALTQGIFAGSVSDLETRHKIDREYDEIGCDALLKRLQKIDPQYAEITHPNNRKRLVRALEIYELTGMTPTQHFKDQKQGESPILKTFSVYLSSDLNNLEKRIRKRTVKMLDHGWIEEVQSLLKTYPNVNPSAINSIGYRQIRQFLEGNLTKNELVDEIVLRTRQFARRQNQWFKKEPIDLVLDINNSPDLNEVVIDIVQNYSKVNAKMK